MFWSACTADGLDVGQCRFNPLAVQACHLCSFLFVCAHLCCHFLLSEQAGNRRIGEASNQASGTQSSTECARSFTERRQMALRARHLGFSNSPPRDALLLYSVKLCVHSVELCVPLASVSAPAYRGE